LKNDGKEGVISSDLLSTDPSTGKEHLTGGEKRTKRKITRKSRKKALKRGQYLHRGGTAFVILQLLLAPK